MTGSSTSRTLTVRFVRSTTRRRNGGTHHNAIPANITMVNTFMTVPSYPAPWVSQSPTRDTPA
ncbi:MAG: hypothetical protein EBV53_10540 [Proteobacteria bacterium]|nr:hypothetical protein [Pseudomonadota bacterium]